MVRTSGQENALSSTPEPHGQGWDGTMAPLTCHSGCSAPLSSTEGHLQRDCGQDARPGLLPLPLQLASWEEQKSTVIAGGHIDMSGF
jgi:hypothetical protein